MTEKLILTRLFVYFKLVFFLMLIISIATEELLCVNYICVDLLETIVLLLWFLILQEG